MGSARHTVSAACRGQTRPISAFADFALSSTLATWKSLGSCVLPVSGPCLFSASFQQLEPGRCEPDVLERGTLAARVRHELLD